MRSHIMVALPRNALRSSLASPSRAQAASFTRLYRDFGTTRASYVNNHESRPSTIASISETTPQPSPLTSSRGYREPIQHPATKRLLDQFNVQGKVYIVTGGGRGLGLMIAEGVAEAGGKVYCLDRLPEPDDEFDHAQVRADSSSGGSLQYKHVDVRDEADLERVISKIAEENGRMDGVVAAAGIQQLTPAIEYTKADIAKMLDINYTGVFMTATTAARQMMKYGCNGSIVLIGSMSGFIANKGLISPVYNSSKAAVIQLGRNLAMEWGSLNLEDGCKQIRVNTLCPGHIVTPMVKKNFEEVPGLRETWEEENMMHRLSDPEEFKGPALFLLSDASSFMTGASLVVDGGHTAW